MNHKGQKVIKESQVRAKKGRQRQPRRQPTAAEPDAAIPVQKAKAFPPPSARFPNILRFVWRSEKETVANYKKTLNIAQNERRCAGHHHQQQTGEQTFFMQLFNRILKEDKGRQLLVQFLEIKDFDQALANYQNKSLFVHIGSGSYADVFRFLDNPTVVILKIIRLLPELLLNRLETSGISRMSAYMEAYNEFQILSTLSRLNQRVEHQGTIYGCQMFPLMYEANLVQGSLPACFRLKRKLIDGDCTDDAEEDQTAGTDDIGDESELEEADYSGSVATGSASASLLSASLRRTQLHLDEFEMYNLPPNVPVENLVLSMEDCGEPICEWLEKISPYAVLSVIKQIITGMMIAESVFQFEHRDLHSGNVLLRKMKSDHVSYIIRGRKYRIPSHGFLVKVIDTTFSRIRINQKVFYKELTYLFDNDDKHLLTADEMKAMRKQDQAYHQMSMLVGDNWDKYYPKTNLFWIRYVIYKLLKASVFQEIESSEETSANKKPYTRSMKQNSGSVNLSPKMRAIHVMNILKHYERLTEKCQSAQDMFLKILDEPRLNDCVRIVQM